MREIPNDSKDNVKEEAVLSQETIGELSTACKSQISFKPVPSLPHEGRVAKLSHSNDHTGISDNPELVEKTVSANVAMASSEVLEAFLLSLSPTLISTEKPFPADFWASTSQAKRIGAKKSRNGKPTW